MSHHVLDLVLVCINIGGQRNSFGDRHFRALVAVADPAGTTMHHCCSNRDGSSNSKKNPNALSALVFLGVTLGGGRPPLDPFRILANERAARCDTEPGAAL